MNKTRIAHYPMKKNEIQQCKKIQENIKVMDPTIDLHIGKVIQFLLHGIESTHLVAIETQDEQNSKFDYYIVQVTGFNNFKLIKIKTESDQCSVEQAIINASSAR